MGKTPDQVPEDKLELYRNLIDTQPDIELRGGLKLPGTPRDTGRAHSPSRSNSPDA